MSQEFRFAIGALKSASAHWHAKLATMNRQTWTVEMAARDLREGKEAMTEKEQRERDLLREEAATAKRREEIADANLRDALEARDAVRGIAEVFRRENTDLASSLQAVLTRWEQASRLSPEDFERLEEVRQARALLAEIAQQNAANRVIGG